MQIVIYLCLLFLFVQDLKYRAVYWWLFLVLPVCLIFVAAGSVPLAEIARRFAVNMLFLLVQLALLWLWLSMRKRRAENLFHYIGPGDILFLAAIAVYLPAVNFIAFYTGSLILVTGAMAFKSRSYRIPLAGYQALLLLLLMVADDLHSGIELTSDTFLLKLLI